MRDIIHRTCFRMRDVFAWIISGFAWAAGGFLVFFVYAWIASMMR